MRSFEQIPRDLLLDGRISVGARLMYPILRYLAWRNGREKDGDAVELPPLDEIAGTLGVATSTAKSYLAELRSTGWIETRRAARNRPTLYVVHDAPREPNIGPPESRISADRDGRASSLLDPHIRTAPAERSSDGPPKLVMVEGRNLALDALVRECGIAPRSNRFKEAATAINTGGPNLDHGIRELAWLDLLEVNPSAAEIPAEAFERYLARAIAEKSKRYREGMRGATLTPFALAKWWTDVERAKPPSPAARAFEKALDLERQGL